MKNEQAIGPLTNKRTMNLRNQTTTKKSKAWKRKNKEVRSLREKRTGGHKSWKKTRTKRLWDWEKNKWKRLETWKRKEQENQELEKETSKRTKHKHDGSKAQGKSLRTYDGIIVIGWC